MKKQSLRPKPTESEPLESWEHQTADYWVCRFLARNPWLALLYDPDDLIHDVLIHWIEVRKGYDTLRGASRKTFMSRVTETKLLEIIRNERAGNRGLNNRAKSLDAQATSDGAYRRGPDGRVGPPKPIEAAPTAARRREEEAEEKDGPTWGDFVDETACGSSDSEPDAINLRRALAEIEAKMTERERQICELLKSHVRKAEIAERLGISRDTVYEDLKRIRKLYEHKGFRKRPD